MCIAVYCVCLRSNITRRQGSGDVRKSIGTTREGCGDRAGAEHSSISQVWLNRMQGGRAVAGGGVPVLTGEQQMHSQEEKRSGRV